MSKLTINHKEFKNINNIWLKVMKKYDSYSSNISIIYSESSLYSYSEWYKNKSAGCKYMNISYHVVTNNLKIKYQYKYGIDY